MGWLATHHEFHEFHSFKIFGQRKSKLGIPQTPHAVVANPLQILLSDEAAPWL